MKKIVIVVLILVVIFTTNIISFAETEYIKTSEFIETVIKEVYGEEKIINPNKTYLPYAIKGIGEGIILPGEIENYNSEISKKNVFKFLDRIEKKESLVVIPKTNKNALETEKQDEYIDKVGFERILNDFLIKIGKREKQGNYFTLEEIKAKFEDQEEMEEYLDLEMGIMNNMKDPYSSGFRNYEKSKELEKNYIKQAKENNTFETGYIQDGIFYKINPNETKERNKLLYDLTTLLNYNGIQNNCDLDIYRSNGATKLKYTPSSRFSSTDKGLFSIYIYDEIDITKREKISKDHNIRIDVRMLGYFGDELTSGKIDAKGIEEKDYMDETVPKVLREALKVIYGDRTDEFMTEIIKDYKVMNNNPPLIYSDVMYSEKREIMDKEFLVDIGFKNVGCSYYDVLN